MSPFEQHPVRQAASLHRGLRRRLVSTYQPERLEPRLALAGVVGLAVTGDVLTITGDALANELWIDPVAPNQICVAPIHDKFSPTGLRDAAGTVGYEPLVFSGIRDVVVRLRGGDDRLIIGGDPEDLRSPVTVLRSLMVDAGPGADGITSFRLDVEGGATFLAGPGSDRIMLEQTRAFGSLSVHGGLDHDIVSLRDATGAAGDVTLVGGAGADWFFVSDGIEVGRNLTLLGGPGDDQVHVGDEAVVYGDLRIEGGLGGDGISVVRDVQVSGPETTRCRSRAVLRRRPGWWGGSAPARTSCGPNAASAGETWRPRMLRFTPPATSSSPRGPAASRRSSICPARDRSVATSWFGPRRR
ncbi:MAG: hypothetical protein ACKOES_03955 [Planctomycetaceae bacterium]